MASWRSVWVFACLGLLGVASVAGAQGQPPQRTTPQPPRNITAHPSVRQLLAEMLLQSATVRRQCARIASTTRVAVTVSLVPRMSRPGRARTTMRKYEAGFIRALVEIPIGADVVELLAHELEHVIEQLDGVDLKAMARVGSQHAAHEIDGVFETVRAQAAGLAAAREMCDRSHPAESESDER